MRFFPFGIIYICDKKQINLEKRERENCQYLSLSLKRQKKKMCVIYLQSTWPFAQDVSRLKMVNNKYRADGSFERV